MHAIFKNKLILKHQHIKLHFLKHFHVRYLFNFYSSQLFSFSFSYLYHLTLGITSDTLQLWVKKMYCYLI